MWFGLFDFECVFTSFFGLLTWLLVCLYLGILLHLVGLLLIVDIC